MSGREDIRMVYPVKVFEKSTAGRHGVLKDAFYFWPDCSSNVATNLSGVFMKRIWIWALMAVTMSCGGSMEFTADRNQASVIVDGHADEWTTGLQFIEDEKLFLGIRQDSDYLYLVIMPQNRMTGIQMLMGGFTVWFDPKGGKNRILGVKFPLEPEGGTMGPMMERGERGKKKNEGLADEFDQQIERRLREYEVVGPGRYDRRRFEKGEDGDIAVEIGVEERGIIYELKIPLRSVGKNYGLDATADWVGVGLETSEKKRERPVGMEGMGMGMGGGGARPGGRTPLGGMGPGGPPSGQQLKWWTKIRLSE